MSSKPQNSSKSSSVIRVGIVGLGMVGDPIRRWFEEKRGYVRGKDLFCFDADPHKKFQDDINKADLIFVAVPTPPNPDGSCNVSIVHKAVATIRDHKIVVIKSTVPPGTVARLQKKYPNKKFIFNPEFLTESQSWLDFVKPDRQIIGHTDESYRVTRELLELMPKAHFERPWSTDYSKKEINATEAELAKYASNVFGYVKVIYGNILADVAHALSLDFNQSRVPSDVDYEHVREVISADPRIGGAWLNVEYGNYCGAGGYCFPKDMNAFISFIGELIEKLSASKKKPDPGLLENLKKGLAVLRSITAYNDSLLKWQGLTLQDVSFHDKEIVTTKRKPIRKQ